MTSWLDKHILGSWPSLENLIAILTLILLIEHAPELWFAKGPVIAICIFGLALRSLQTQAEYWLVLAAILGSVLINNWFWLDNHKFLEFYWVLALFCAYSTDGSSRELLKFNAALLLACCMILAVIWKAISPDYLSGEFFHFTLLTDPRFESFTAFLGQIADSSLQQNRFLYDQHQGVSGLEKVFTLQTSPQIKVLARFLTWWTILIEASIGLLFLFANWSERARKLGCWLLVTFALTTYAVATVKGFAWLLILFALAQTKDEERVLRLVLVVTFAVIQIYTLPFGQVSEALTW